MYTWRYIFANKTALNKAFDILCGQIEHVDIRAVVIDGLYTELRVRVALRMSWCLHMRKQLSSMPYITKGQDLRGVTRYHKPN